MKTLNLKNLQVKTISGNVTEVDLRETVAEQIYSSLGGLKTKLLAEKIYKSEGDFEIDDKEEEIFKALVSDSSEFFNNKVADAIREQLK
ncbi:hypothetical protein DXA95_12255 [Odoribacter sp. OF09-27XD]|mgnify:FL=1|jgi:hypothetical protein|nr:hypothetical protein [Odoribacter sp. OF09-27XD]RHV92570.1 hypothetical protein DXA95_12255 [Odoribacter sp. OF09-27XD]DAV89690.1 MAG TPA: hypothetical protein [Bacteriophage sp.]